MTHEHPDQEGFGEASLGEGQAEDPALDPDMLEDDLDAASLDDLEDVGDEDDYRIGDYDDPDYDPDDPDLKRYKGG